MGRLPEPTWSVGELGDALDHLLRRAMPDEVWVRGEIHDLTRARSGHVYFTLVEDRLDGSRASLAVMLAARHKPAVNRTLTAAGGAVRMTDGTEVRVRGRIAWFAPRGQVQLGMTAIDPAHTLGRLALERAGVLARLGAEGLLAANRSRPMPALPLVVGLVTSRGSAAEADVLAELSRSGIAFEVVSVDARVQGPTSPSSLATAIETLGRRRVDVVVIVRGGGVGPTSRRSTARRSPVPSPPARTRLWSGSATRSTAASPTRSPTPAPRPPQRPPRPSWQWFVSAWPRWTAAGRPPRRAPVPDSPTTTSGPG